MRLLYNTQTHREVKVTEELFDMIMNDKNKKKYFSEIVKVIEQEPVSIVMEPKVQTEYKIEDTVEAPVKKIASKKKTSKK